MSDFTFENLKGQLGKHLLDAKNWSSLPRDDLQWQQRHRQVKYVKAKAAFSEGLCAVVLWLFLLLISQFI